MQKKVIDTSVKNKMQSSDRSPLWAKTRAAYLKSNPKCAVCGSDKKVEVHHKQPFHIHPELELDPANFISLCESKSTLNCHLIIGHGGNFKDVNPDVEKDAAHFNDLLTNWQIKSGGVTK